MKNITAQRITGVAVAAALMAIAAQISIPLPFLVPVTLQVPVMLAAGLILGPYTAAAAMAVYLAMGLSGLPVFANFGGGAAYVFKPGFGFLIGFVPASWTAGVLSRRNSAVGSKGYGSGVAAAQGGGGVVLSEPSDRTQAGHERAVLRLFRNYTKLLLPVLALYAAGLSYQFFALCVFNGFSPKAAFTAVTASLGIFLLADILKTLPLALAYERLVSLRKYAANRRQGAAPVKVK